MANCEDFLSLSLFSGFPSEKPSSHPAGGGTKRSGAADHERGGQPESGLAAQLPHPQHVQRGPGGHLHQGGRRQTLAGQRSVVFQLMSPSPKWFISLIDKSIVAVTCCTGDPPEQS